MIDLPNGWRIVCFLELEQGGYRATLRQNNRMEYITALSINQLKKDCLEYSKDVDKIKENGVIRVKTYNESQAIRFLAKSQKINISSRKAMANNEIVYILTKL
jgi:hypothetical protein